MTDGIIWVVDSVDRCRLEECRKQLRDILSQEKLAGASLLIFANKQDLGICTSINCSINCVLWSCHAIVCFIKLHLSLLYLLYFTLL